MGDSIREDAVIVDENTVEKVRLILCFYVL